MDAKLFARVAGTLFGLVALAHVVRLVQSVPVTIGSRRAGGGVVAGPGRRRRAQCVGLAGGVIRAFGLTHLRQRHVDAWRTPTHTFAATRTGARGV